MHKLLEQANNYSDIYCKRKRCAYIFLMIAGVVMLGEAPGVHPELRVGVERDVGFNEVLVGQQVVGNCNHLDLAERRRTVVGLAARVVARSDSLK